MESVVFHVFRIYPQPRLKFDRSSRHYCDLLAHWSKALSRDEYIVNSRRQGKFKPTFSAKLDHPVADTTPTTNKNKGLRKGAPSNVSATSPTSLPIIGEDCCARTTGKHQNNTLHKVKTVRVGTSCLIVQILSCLLAFQRCRGMQMADRNCEGIGGVRRLGNFRQIQQPRNHVLHLLLLCPAVADNRGFNRQR